VGPSFAPIAGCTVERNCGECPDYLDAGLTVQMDQGVLSRIQPCSGGIHVRDLAAGETTDHTISPSYLQYPWALSGDYIAYYDAPKSGTELVVRNWRTGTVLYSFEIKAATSLDVRDDGLVVLAEERSLEWASADSPVPHPFATAPANVAVRIAGDRVGFHTGQYAPGLRGTVRLDGSGLVTIGAPAAAGPDVDFDGERMVWATQPCGVAAIVEWDLHGSAPALPAGRCPLPRLVTHSPVVGRDRRLPLTLRCGSSPLGCRGTLYVQRERVDDEPALAYREYTLDPNSSATVRPRLSRYAACHMPKGARLTATFTAPARYHPNRTGPHRSVRVKIRGLKRLCG
jgi:hypothetical protein